MLLVDNQANLANFVLYLYKFSLANLDNNDSQWTIRTIGKELWTMAKNQAFEVCQLICDFLYVGCCTCTYQQFWQLKRPIHGSLGVTDRLAQIQFSGDWPRLIGGPFGTAKNPVMSNQCQLVRSIQVLFYYINIWPIWPIDDWTCMSNQALDKANR